ncbi:hypothetical protein ADUPG1_011499 [Aduncisulcus paluster]|uniref:Uncharacterized protein n=1 Tax=Aduncisulcus paluster TaxID=2918883 RepID=A0ABQ5JYE1_9EUKA|nr:hypothetical protein ADUPG1_011499 [Aduncisulcus paluster]
MTGGADLESASEYVRPDYHEETSKEYKTKLRNFIGVKLMRLLRIDYTRMEVVLFEIDSGKRVLTVPAKDIQKAMKSFNVVSQVTMVLNQPNSLRGREKVKVWTDDSEISRVPYIIRDINLLVQRYKAFVETAK